MKNKCHVNWFEISVTDFEKAKKFYSQMFGWEFRLLKDYASEYWTIFTGFNSPGGGLLKRDNAIKDYQGVRIYVEVDNIDTLLKECESYGGKVFINKKLITESSGYSAVVFDPDGNEIGLWSSK